MRKCDFEGCTKAARFKPVLKIWAFKQDKSEKPARAVLSVGSCAAHIGQVTVNDFVNDDSWGKIISGFFANSLKTPDRESCQLARQKIKTKNIMGR